MALVLLNKSDSTHERAKCYGHTRFVMYYSIQFQAQASQCVGERSST